MKRIFHHFKYWEDFLHGMYNEDRNGRPARVQKAVSVLGVPETCEQAMQRVVEEWPIATEYNLSNAEINRRAWLGQAACSIWADVHEDETREAWGILTAEQRQMANAIATRIIKAWLRENDTEAQTGQTSLFDDWSEFF